MTFLIMQSIRSVSTLFPNTLFKAESRKANITFVLSVCLSICIRAAPAGRISIKLGTEHFYENLSRNSKPDRKVGHFT